MRRQVLLSKQTPGEASLSFPDPEMMLECTLTPNDEGSGKHFYYFIAPAMRAHVKMSPRLRLYNLRVICVHPGGIIMLWPVPVVGHSKPVAAWKSYNDAAKMALTEWTSMVWSDESAGWRDDWRSTMSPPPDN